MTISQSTLRKGFLVLNGISIALVFGGVANFFLLGHDFWESQWYLIAALIVAIGAVVVRQLLSQVAANEMRREALPLEKPKVVWIFSSLGLCVLIAVLNATTDAFASPLIALVVVAILLFVGGKVIIERRRFLSRGQRVVIAFAVCAALVGIFRLVLLFSKFA
jgi:hypothetical protein